MFLGIPDYRSAKVGQYARSKHRPIDHHDFMRSEKWRKRYWARNYVGWPAFSSSKPNTNHYKIASWEGSGKVLLLLLDNFSWSMYQNYISVMTIYFYSLFGL